jgi:mono/diheme cytochrome c family protein
MGSCTSFQVSAQPSAQASAPPRDLLALIEQGTEARAMPAFGAILSPLQRQAVLAYLRSAFGAPAP